MKIIVYKNSKQVGTVTIDDQSLLSKTGVVPDSVESSIVVGILRDKVAFGSQMVGNDRYHWNEEMPANPTALLPISWWERLQKLFPHRN